MKRKAAWADSLVGGDGGDSGGDCAAVASIAQTRLTALNRAPSRRNRRTVHLDAPTFAARLAQAVTAELLRLQSPAGSALTEGPGDESAARVRDDLLALLKAFLDAARPAGGLPLGGDGRARDLSALVARGRVLARSAESPRLLAKLRAGQPVDLRLAQATLHFFRLALDRPQMSLEHIGAVETDRLRAVRSVERAIRAARDDLPASILEGLLRRAQEAASDATVMDVYVREYRGLHLFTDEHGVRRLGLTQITRYRPLRLVSWSGAYRPSISLEWHQWSRTGLAELTVTELDAADRPLHRQSILVRKRLDDAQGLVVFDVDPAASPSRAANGFAATDVDGRSITYQFEWQLTLVLNAADRDMVVAYVPVNAPRIVFDADAEAGFVLQVGDSPGLDRTPDGWRLNRTLMPREVLAVRIRSRELARADAFRLSPSGEWRPGSPAEEIQ